MKLGVQMKKYVENLWIKYILPDLSLNILIRFWLKKSAHNLTKNDKRKIWKLHILPRRLDQNHLPIKMIYRFYRIQYSLQSSALTCSRVEVKKYKFSQSSNRLFLSILTRSLLKNIFNDKSLIAYYNTVDT